jgi:hypothetical protein
MPEMKEIQVSDSWRRAIMSVAEKYQTRDSAWSSLLQWRGCRRQNHHDISATSEVEEVSPSPHDRVTLLHTSREWREIAPAVAYMMLVSRLAYSSILKMEMIFSSETSVDFQTDYTALCPKILYSDRCENLKS